MTDQVKVEETKTLSSDPQGDPAPSEPTEPTPEPSEPEPAEPAE